MEWSSFQPTSGSHLLQATAFDFTELAAVECSLGRSIERFIGNGLKSATVIV